MLEMTTKKPMETATGKWSGSEVRLASCHNVIILYLKGFRYKRGQYLELK